MLQGVFQTAQWARHTWQGLADMDDNTRVVIVDDVISAGTSTTTPRAMPSFKVEAAFWLTKVYSTAASAGR